MVERQTFNLVAMGSTPIRGRSFSNFPFLRPVGLSRELHLPRPLRQGGRAANFSRLLLDVDVLPFEAVKALGAHLGSKTLAAVARPCSANIWNTWCLSFAMQLAVEFARRRD